MSGPDPLLLGRSVVVHPGQAPPGAWADCPRLAVTGIDREVAERLNGAWRERRALVVELGAGVGLDDPARPPDERVEDRQPWEWPDDLRLTGEDLHHGLWANAVDARGGRLSNRWVEEALALGARLDPTGSADVLLPDGTPAVCDGGPLDASLPTRLGMAVVTRLALEHGELRPLGPNDPVGQALAADQLAAVTHPGTGARVIAPAGSGKTRVLTERARLLLRGWHLPSAAVALVAFNVRAREEMQARLSDVPGMRIRTLNSVGLALCGGRTTVAEPEVREILSGLVTFPRRAEADPAAPWIEALGRVRLGLRAPAAVEAELPDVSGLEDVARSYRRLLADKGLVDFDEQVVGAIERLLADPPFRRRTQRFARVVLVDEFQDLTPAHLLLLRLLTGPAGTVFGVGDDDQTIYGYAGASPRFLVDFERWFPGSAEHSLQVNYRCPPAVVTAATNLLTRNGRRVPKTIRPAPGRRSGPADLEVVTGPEPAAARSARRVVERLADGAAPSDVAVLARVNAALAPVQVLLRHRSIPVQGGVDTRFLRRGGVRAALAWLRVTGAPADAVPGPALRDAARRPKRGMSDSLLTLVARQHSARELERLAAWLLDKGSDREATKVSGLAHDVELARRAAEAGTTSQVLAVVRRDVAQGGLDASAHALDAWSHGVVAAHADDLDALAVLAELEPDPARFEAWLAEHLERAEDPDGVTLASIHAVKGREWPHVVLHEVTDGVLPHRLVDDVEEERRVFHVGLTRGRLSVAVAPGSPVSPFVAELEAPGAPPPPQAPLPRGATTGGVRPVATGSRAPRAGGAADAAEPVPVAPGLRFAHGGYDHEVAEVLADGVRLLVGGGPATTTLPYGTPVRVGGIARVLAHPAYELAWDRLRTWRRERARATGKPAYVIFDDRTLRAVAVSLPVSEPGLLSIGGIGPVKLETWGDELLALVEELRSP